MKRRLLVGVVSCIVLLAGCSKPAGKDELRTDKELRAQILKDCANGTHASAQECSNAKAAENQEKLDQSLGAH